ncbi:MAG: hypothetical protein RIA65_06965, partial [Woeseia sp.]
MTKLSGRASARGVMAVTDLRDFFRESIDDAIANQRVTVDTHTTHYVVNVLTLFSRSEEFYEDSGEV